MGYTKTDLWVAAEGVTVDLALFIDLWWDTSVSQVNRAALTLTLAL